jgi:hypothetical protein
MILTVCPASAKYSAIWEPIKPAPPVTNTFMLLGKGKYKIKFSMPILKFMGWG